MGQSVRKDAVSTSDNHFCECFGDREGDSKRSWRSGGVAEQGRPVGQVPVVVCSSASKVSDGTHGQTKPKHGDTLVDTAAVRGSQGRISLLGRYCTERELLDDYTLDSHVVGSGMSGPVQLATENGYKKKVAVKSFKKKGLSMKRRAELKSEVEIYLRLDHPHVARLERVYETEDDIHLVMEYMAGGELYSRLSSLKTYTEEDASKTTFMMLLAVAYLHGHHIAHRDLKLENFLYEATEGAHKDVLKLIDFGFAKFWDHNCKMSQACGSIHYVAPEVLQHAYTEKADMWSLGVITYMLLTGSPPFFGSDDQILRKIRAGQPHWCSRFHKLSEPAKSFVRRLLVLDPTKRYSAEEALNDEWIQVREAHKETFLDVETLQSLKTFGHASSFKRAVLSMMAWSLDVEDRTELREMFLSMDKEKRGTIRCSELKKVLEDLFHIDDVEAEHIFRHIDNNNDGEVAYSEFLAAACIGRVKVHEDLLRKTFAKFDTGHTGKVSTDNLKSILGEEFEGVKVNDFVRQVDTDSDGNIDYDEFISYFHREDEHSEALGPSSEKELHREKLCRVVERLVRAESLPFHTESIESSPTGPAISPTASPKPVLRRRQKAKTFCIEH